MIIKNAVIHTVTNGTIENGYIEFDEKIISLGDIAAKLKLWQLISLNLH